MEIIEEWKRRCIYLETKIKLGSERVDNVDYVSSENDRESESDSNVGDFLDGRTKTSSSLLLRLGDLELDSISLGSSENPVKVLDIEPVVNES